MQLFSNWTKIWSHYLLYILRTKLLDTVQFKISFGQFTKLTGNRVHVCLGFWAGNTGRNLTSTVRWGVSV